MSTTENTTVSTQYSQKIITLGGLETFYNELKDNHLGVIDNEIEEIRNIIEENEEVTASALNDLDNKVNTIDNEIDEIRNIIEENEETTAGALNDINNKVNTINSTVIDNEKVTAGALNYLDNAIQNMPLEKGSAENSVVLKGEYEGYSNKAISQTSMAIGAATTASLKGWYYRDYEGNLITILTTQPTLQNGRLVGGTPAEPHDVKQAFKVGDVVSFVNNQKYDRYAKVEYVEDNRVMLNVLIGGNLSTEVIINDIDDWSIFLPDKPHLGAVDFGFGAFAEGGMSKSINMCSHAEGFDTESYGQFSHTEGKETKAAYAAHAEGVGTMATGNDAHAEGHLTKAPGHHSHSEGRETRAEGYAAHAEGLYSLAGPGIRPAFSDVVDAGRCAHAEGNGTQASGVAAHSEGKHTLASGNFAHSEGFNTEATFQCAHSEGTGTKATNIASHSEGSGTTASGSAAHAEGINTVAAGRASHSDGFATITNNEGEHACGRFNLSVKSENQALATRFSIGNGTDSSTRRNAVEVKANGDVYITGIGGFTGANSSSSKSVQEVINELVNKLNEITTNN